MTTQEFYELLDTYYNNEITFDELLDSYYNNGFDEELENGLLTGLQVDKIDNQNMNFLIKNGHSGKPNPLSKKQTSEKIVFKEILRFYSKFNVQLRYAPLDIRDLNEKETPFKL